MDQDIIIEKIRELLAKDKLSEDEMSWLLQYQDDVQYDLQQDFIVNKALTAAPSAAAIARAAVLKQQFTPVPQPTVRSIKHWLRYAAAILLLVSAGSYFLWNHLNSKTPIGVESQVNDKAPGGNKALLILADGRELVLDSLQKGLLATEGNSQISTSEAGTLMYYYNDNGTLPGPLRYNTLKTPKGGQHQLILPDGSKVWLNAASQIEYPVAFSGNERRVKVSGELYFDVATKASMPFIVETDGLRVEVLGTAFNINCYANETNIQTTLVNGMVRVTPTKSKETVIGKSPTAAGSQDAILLKPGEQATLIHHNSATDQPEFIKTTNLNIATITAWKEGLFNFDGADLYSVMRQLERWYDIEVKYIGQVENIKFKGRLHRNTHLSGVLKALAIMDVNFELKENILYVK